VSSVSRRFRQDGWDRLALQPLRAFITNALQPGALIKQSPGHKCSYLAFPAAAASCPASD
jgi:hypothetical protein